MRRIDYIVVHSSASPEGREDTVEDVRRWHAARRFKDIGYHFIIELDGICFDGRPLSQAGAHVRGHNPNTIGICYIGGTDNTPEKKPKDTRTEAQKRTLRKLISDLKQMFPNATVLGHRDLAATACPSFDAKSEYKDL